MLKTFLAFVVAMGLIFLGFPFALVGFAGLYGTLPETSRLESMQTGMSCSLVAAAAWGMSLTLSWWANGYELPSRFSLRSLMIGMTLTAVTLGLLVIRSH